MPLVVLGLLNGCVEVRLRQGRGFREEYLAVERFVGGHFKGIQHSKTLIVDIRMLVGSCNWTTSSRSNLERTALIQVQSSALEEMMAEHDRVWSSASTLAKEPVQE